MEQKPRKIVVVALSLLLVFSSVFIMDSTTHAWSGDISQCPSGTWNNYATDWNSVTKVNDETADHPPLQNYVVVKNADGVSLYSTSGRITAMTIDGENYISFPDTTIAYFFPQGADSLYSIDDPTQNAPLWDVTCFAAEYGVTNSTDNPYLGTPFWTSPSTSPSPSPSSSSVPGLTDDEATKFAQKVGILLAFAIGGWFVFQFRFGRHE